MKGDCKGPKTVTAIVMASGFSRRMGENKLLLPVNGRPMISYVLETLCGIEELTRVILVAKDDEVIAIGKDCGAETVKNQHSAEGMSRSILLGLFECREDFYIFVPGDQPFVDAENLRKLIRAAEPGRITVPVFDGDEGNPCVFSSDFREEFMGLKGEEGGRKILKNNPHKIIHVEIDNPNFFTDIDDKETLLRIKEL